MKQTKHQPGIKTHRQFTNYNAFQEELWAAFDDFYYADVGGYGDMRMPTPGKYVEPTKTWNLDFNNWKLLVQERWQAESGRDALTRGVTLEEFPENLWYYLYERMLDATNKHYTPKGKPTMTSNTPTNNTCPDPGLQSLNTIQGC
jgi:hypothetical protein|tara:strand:+ start:1995 stop:2429 length:435 start_codon:yes stop_codon:yes gene_type:complete